MSATFSVEPITRGYQGSISIVYPATLVAVYPLMSGDLTADFRTKAGDSVRLFRATSIGGSIVRTLNGDGSVQIDIAIPASETLSFPVTGVAFDIAHTVAGVSRLLPGQWSWPVKPSVTVLP